MIPIVPERMMYHVVTAGLNNPPCGPLSPLTLTHAPSRIGLDISYMGKIVVRVYLTQIRLPFFLTIRLL